MKAREWSIWKAAIAGAVIGVPLVVFRELIAETGSLPATAADWLVFIFGGAVGGMFLFALVAAVRNFFVCR